MDERLFREIAEEYLVPFFSGATLESESERSNRWQDRVQLLDNNTIAFRPTIDATYKLILSRQQSFSREKDVIPETAVVEAFVDVLAQMGEAITGPFREDLLAAFQRRVVAKAISGAEGDEDILLLAIDQLANWATRLYEGSPISAAIGFRHTRQDVDEVTLDQIQREDFGAVLSNGHDTLLEFDFSGRFIDHICLQPGESLPRYCPYRQAPIAEWTTDHERRVALSLNRLGEILVFRKHELLFARRSGRWSFLTHRAVITQMGSNMERALREAIYISCIDASFARTGACVGIVDDADDVAKILNPNDDIRSGDSTKVRAIKKIVNGSNFKDLDRRLRQELLAIDGATILTSDGAVLAAGSILKIPGGSTGGGRLAAAKQLGRHGLGIKVSQDGNIVGFRSKGSKSAHRISKLAFRIM